MELCTKNLRNNEQTYFPKDGNSSNTTKLGLQINIRKNWGIAPSLEKSSPLEIREGKKRKRELVL